MLDEFRSTYIAWDKATRRIYSPITANESDENGRKLNIQVVNSGQVENLTGATLHLYWETKDKSQYGLDAFTASDISKGEFEIFYTTGMLSNVGELNATLVLVDATGQVVSDWFKITVARGIDGDAIQSENSFTTLTQALIDVSNLEQNYAPRLNDLTAQLQQTVSHDKRDKRPSTYEYDYEKSPSKFYPNFLGRLESGDLTKLKVVFVGNSHTAGQGATETGGEKVPEIPPPAGVTDGFHKRDASSGVFVDKVARQMEKAYGLSITKRIVSASEKTYYNLRTGSWTESNDTRMGTASGSPYLQTSTVNGDYIIKQLDPDIQQRCASFYFARVPSGGILNVEVKTNNSSATGLKRDDANVWKKPSEIEGMVRSDGATGTAMDTIDLYNATADYNYLLGYTFPFFANWQVKLTISGNKNPSASTGNHCSIGTTILEHENFINAGRGNHTTLDYLGNTVTKGAGGSGDLDHTDHLAEVLALNPSLIILEPMIINDWFHGVNLQDTTTCLQEMIRRIKKANCDVLVITPAPVVTDLVVLDYEENSEYTTKPPLTNNLHGLGNYEQYIDAVLKVAYWEQVPVINNYKYFLERFYKADHQNWTLGSLAGRIHVNQHGHDIYTDGIIQFSGLFPATLNAL